MASLTYSLSYPRRISCGQLFPFARGEPLARVASRLLESGWVLFKWEGSHMAFPVFLFYVIRRKNLGKV